MNSHQAMIRTLSALGLRAICPICGADCNPRGMCSVGDGPMICDVCARDLEICTGCGDVLGRSDVWRLSNGDPACEGCHPLIEAEWDEDRKHERQERHGWEQV